MTDRQRLLHMALRQDLASFIRKSFHTVAPAENYLPNWHIDAIAWHLDRCASGEINRLLITLPPRHLKSICASVAFPAWLLGHEPTMRIVCASYSSDLAAKHARDCRAVMNSAWYRRIFPNTRLSREKNAELDFITTRRGYRYATSVGGTLTGRGGNLIIVDDAIKPEDAMSDTRRKAANEWFDRTLYSRLDDKRNDTIIVIMQRLHVDDLAGHILKKEDWTHLDLPAIAEIEQHVPIGAGRVHHRSAGDVLHPEREPLEVLERIKASMGSFNFSSQYQQCPIPPEGEIIKWSWFRFYNGDPPRRSGDRIVQSWDTAMKAGEFNDYSVCTTWIMQDNDYYLIDVLREKLKYPDLRRRAIDHALAFSAQIILIEDKGSGTALIEDLNCARVRTLPRPIAYTPMLDKLTRMHAQSARIEAGHVVLPERAPWLDDFRSELLQFPHGKYDDQVDSVSQLLEWWEKRKYQTVTVVKLTGF